MQLCQNALHFFGNGQAELRCVFRERQRFVGQIEDQHRAAQGRARAEQRVDGVRHADENQNQHLPANAAKAHGAGKPSGRDGTQYAGEIIERHKYDQREQQPMICTGSLRPADGSPWEEEVRVTQVRAVAPVQPAAVNNNAATLEALEKLAKLHEQGILTDEEFQQKKRNCLENCKRADRRDPTSPEAVGPRGMHPIHK